MLPSPFFRGLFVIIASSLAWPNPAVADIIIYHGDLTVDSKTAGIGNEVQIGDIIYWQFSIDDSFVDDDPSLTRGNFYNFKEVYLVRAETNASSWNPNGLPNAQMNTFPLGLFNVSNVIDGNSSVVSVSGNPVTHFQMNNLLLADINDTGAGQTWAEQVTNLHSFGVADFNYYNPVDGSQEVVRTAVSNFGIGSHPAITSVPEPSTLALAGWCFACTMLRGRFRKRN